MKKRARTCNVLIFAALGAWLCAGAGSADESDVARDSLDTVRRFVSAVVAGDGAGIQGCMTARDQEESRLAAAYAARVVAYRRLIHAAADAFPRGMRELSAELSDMTDATYEQVTREVQSAKVKSSGRSATVTIADPAEPSMLDLVNDSGIWKLSTYKLFGLDGTEPLEEIRERGRDQRNLAALADRVRANVEQKKFSSMESAMDAFDDQRMTIVMSEMPTTRPTTEPSPRAPGPEAKPAPAAPPPVPVSYEPGCPVYIGVGGRTVGVSYADGVAGLWRLDTSELAASCRLSESVGRMEGLVPAPSDLRQLLLVYEDNARQQRVAAVDCATGRELWNQTGHHLELHDLLGWSGDGKEIFASTMQNQLSALDFATGSAKVLMTLFQDSAVRGTRWWDRTVVTHDARICVVVFNDRVMGLDLSQKKQMWSFDRPGEIRFARSQACISDKIIIRDLTAPGCELVDCKSGAVKRLAPLSGEVIAVNEDSTSFVSQDGPSIFLHVVSGDRQIDLSNVVGANTTFSFSGDGRWLTAAAPVVSAGHQDGNGALFLHRANNRLFVFDAQTGRPAATITLDEPAIPAETK